MKLSEIIKTNSWLNVEPTFKALYPEEITYIPSFEKVFKELKTKEPVFTPITIVVKFVIDEITGDQGHYEVSGYENLNLLIADTSAEPLALEFVPWSQWLGMDIDPGTLNEFNELELICHCLYEMTFNGFEEKEIQEKYKEIESMVQGFNEEGSLVNPMPMSKFIAKYNLDHTIDN